MKINEFIDAEIKRIINEEEDSPTEFLGVIVEKVKAQFNTDCTYDCIGGFDSPGYDITCYAFAYIEDGAVKIHGYNYECY